MGPCEACGSVIDEQALEHAVGPLRDLTARDFYICHDCTTVIADGCIRCGGGVYVPRDTRRVPDYCPACRNDLEFTETGDPGWYAPTKLAE